MHYVSQHLHLKSINFVSNSTADLLDIFWWFQYQIPIINLTWEIFTLSNMNVVYTITLRLFRLTFCMWSVDASIAGERPYNLILYYVLVFWSFKTIFYFKFTTNTKAFPPSVNNKKNKTTKSFVYSVFHLLCLPLR